MRKPLFVAGLLLALIVTMIGCTQDSPQPTEQIFAVQVNYDRSIEDGVQAGHYDSSYLGFTSQNFPDEKTAGTKSVLIHLVQFHGAMSADQVLVELDKWSLRPATLKECLAFGEERLDAQRQVAFLGSMWQEPNGDRGYPYVVREGLERYLCLGWDSNGRWNRLWSFAAVSKSDYQPASSGLQRDK